MRSELDVRLQLLEFQVSLRHFKEAMSYGGEGTISQENVVHLFKGLVKGLKWVLGEEFD